jgi:AcrR family transcriptional regulator
VATPTVTKGERARARVLDAVIDAVAARGLADLSIAEIGEAAGMSAGHVMYYFGTKDALFVEALRHSEGFLDSARLRLLNRTGSPPKILRDYSALYLPVSDRDARWSLWLEVWNQSLTNPDLGAVQLELDARWQLDLESIIHSGVKSSDFVVPDTNIAVDVISSLLDGIAVRMITGTPGLDRRKAIGLATSACEQLLGSPSRRTH